MKLNIFGAYLSEIWLSIKFESFLAPNWEMESMRNISSSWSSYGAEMINLSPGQSLSGSAVKVSGIARHSSASSIARSSKNSSVASTLSWTSNNDNLCQRAIRSGILPKL